MLILVFVWVEEKSVSKTVQVVVFHSNVKMNTALNMHILQWGSNWWIQTLTLAIEVSKLFCRFWAISSCRSWEKGICMDLSKKSQVISKVQKNSNLFLVGDFFEEIYLLCHTLLQRVCFIESSCIYLSLTFATLWRFNSFSICSLKFRISAECEVEMDS